MLRTAAAALIALMALSGQAAHAEEIGTDRPDFAESSAVVGKGRFQIETSLAGLRDSAGGSRTRLTGTPTLLRYGIADTVELRLETDGWQRSTVTDTATGLRVREKGAADASLGLKWHVRDGDEKAGSAALAWLLHADIDSGSAAYRGQGVRPSLRLAMEWELDDEVSVGLMPGLLLDRREGGGRYAVGIAAVTVSKGWTERWHSYLELAGQRLASKKNGGSVVTLDVGATYLLTQDVQLDLGVSFGTTRYTPDFAWTTGVSIRF